jgi:hypothetical protein
MTTLISVHGNSGEFHGVNNVGDKIRPLSQMVTATGDEPSSYDKTTIMVFKKEKKQLMEIFIHKITWISELHRPRIKDIFLTDWIARKREISCTNPTCNWSKFLIPIEGPAALKRHLEECRYPLPRAEWSSAYYHQAAGYSKMISSVYSARYPGIEEGGDEVYDSTTLVPIEPDDKLMSVLILHHGERLPLYESLYFGYKMIRPLYKLGKGFEIPSYSETVWVFIKEKKFLIWAYSECMTLVDNHHTNRMNEIAATAAAAARLRRAEVDDENNGDEDDEDQHVAPPIAAQQQDPSSPPCAASGPLSTAGGGSGGAADFAGMSSSASSSSSEKNSSGLGH